MVTDGINLERTPWNYCTHSYLIFADVSLLTIAKITPLLCIAKRATKVRDNT